MNENFQVQNDLMKAKLKEVGNFIKSMLPPHLGFTLMIFDYYDQRLNDTGSMFYLSSARREDIIKSLREMADKLEKEI